MMQIRSVLLSAAMLTSGIAVPAHGQATANATTGAEDAFGYRSGDESVGIYDEGSVRGFNLEVAGNYRINGTYFVKNSGVSSFFLDSTTIRIGYNTLNALLPGPLGVVDYRLRDPSRGQPSLFSLERDANGGLHADLHYRHRSADERASYSVGLGLTANGGTYQGGDRGRSLLVAGVTRQTLGPLTARMFGGEYQYRRPSLFRVVPSGDELPPEIKRGRYLGQRWSVEKGQRRIAGALLDIGEEEALGAGATLVFSQEDPTRGFRQLIGDLRPDGSARHTMIALPQQRSTSWSGELRAHRQWASGPVRHRVDVMMRGRRSRASFGGALAIDLGRAPFGEPSPRAAEPDLSGASARNRNEVDQWGIGASYRTLVGDWLAVNAGALRTNYSKTARSADHMHQISTSPLLYNIGVALRPILGLDLYATYSRGLEEAGVAPANAANRDTVLEAIRATQRELGLRYRISDSVRFAAGAFETKKPYIGLDGGTGIYGPLGQVRHRGFELSLAGKPAPGLSLVLGGVFLDPRNSGPLVSERQIGGRPVGVPRVRAVANVDYALPWVAGLSVDAAWAHVGPRPVRSLLDADGEQLLVPAMTIVDAGLRYRFLLGNTPVVARVQLLNVTDRFAWDVESSETIAYAPGRRTRLVLTTEF